MREFKSDRYLQKRKSTPFGVLFLFWRIVEVRFEELDATVRWNVAADGLTEANINFSSRREEKCNQIWPVLFLMYLKNPT